MPRRPVPRAERVEVVADYRPRFVTEAQLVDLVNLYHLARTALNEGRGATPYERMVWAAGQFAKENEGITSTGAYKDLCASLGRG